VDADLDIDRYDIQAIFSARNTSASGPGDPRDANGDGLITIGDGRLCVLACSLPRCAVIRCGDGIVNGPEECDDGNTVPGDGCSEVCTAELASLSSDELPVIVLSENPTHAALLAADELRHHLGAVFGAYPGVRLGPDGSTGSEQRILVGSSTETQELGVPTDFASDEYLIDVKPSTIVLVGKDDTGVRADDLFLWAEGQDENHSALSFEGESWYTTGRIDVQDFASGEGSIEGWVWLDERPGLIVTVGYYQIANLGGEDPSKIRLRYGVYDAPATGTTPASFFSAPWSPPLEQGWHYFRARHSYGSTAAESWIQLCVDQWCSPKRYGLRYGFSGKPETLGIHIGGTENNALVGRKRGSFYGRIDSLRVSSNEDTLLLFNFDEGEGMPLDESGSGHEIVPMLNYFEGHDLFDDHGSLLAAYDFLERFLSVRWYLPDERGTSVIEQQRIEILVQTIRRQLWMAYRETPGPGFWSYLIPPYVLPQEEEGKIVLPAEDSVGERILDSDAQRWRLRMRLGGKRFTSAHAFDVYWDRFGVGGSETPPEHPEWFTLMNDGRRPMCFSNPDFRDQVVIDALRYFTSNRTDVPYGARVSGDCYSISPSDLPIWDEPGCNEGVQQDGNGFFATGRASDLIWDFVNEVARKVREGTNDEDARICSHAYWDYARYPSSIPDTEFEENIHPKLALLSRHWAKEKWSDWKDNDQAILEEWRDRLGDRPIYTRAYYNWPAYRASIGGYFPLPGFTPRGVIDFMKVLRDQDVTGLYGKRQSHILMRTKSVDWSYHKNADLYRKKDPWNFHSYLLDQLELYLTYKLADNPTLDGKVTIVDHGNALLEEFFSRYYGRAAGSMRAFYDEVEAAYTIEGSSFDDEKQEDLRSIDATRKGRRRCCEMSDECNACINECPSPADACKDACVGEHLGDLEFLCVHNGYRRLCEWHDWRDLGTQQRMMQLESYLDTALAEAVDDLVKTRLELFVRGVWCRMVYEYNFNAKRYAENVPLDSPALCE
jgi:cysteine-rich repeat protein